MKQKRLKPEPLFMIVLLITCISGVLKLSFIQAQENQRKEEQAGQLNPGGPDTHTGKSPGRNSARDKEQDNLSRGSEKKSDGTVDNESGKKALQQSFHESIDKQPGKILDQKYTPGESPLVPEANIKVYRSSSAVVIPAQLVQRDVLLEVFLAAEGGKTHESIFMTKERPKKMNLSLIMAGFKPEENSAKTGPQYLGDPTLPGGDAVIPFVEWELDNGKWVRFRGEHLLYNVEENIIMRNVGFTFAGSYFIEEKSPNRKKKDVFAASRIKTLVALFHDPSAILDLPVPQGGTDGLYQPRTSVLPPKGTEVRLLLKAPDENEQKEIEQQIAASKNAWKDRKEQLRKKQERKGKSE